MRDFLKEYLEARSAGYNTLPTECCGADWRARRSAQVEGGIGTTGNRGNGTESTPGGVRTVPSSFRPTCPRHSG